MSLHSLKCSVCLNHRLMETYRPQEELDSSQVKRGGRREQQKNSSRKYRASDSRYLRKSKSKTEETKDDTAAKI